MHFDAYGSIDAPAVIMLHGAFFADSFCRQYSLSDRYRLIIPHIKGFGRASAETFTADDAVAELEELLEQYAPACIVGYSLGAQLAFRMVCERPDWVRKAIIVSPWLINKEKINDEVIAGNLKMLYRLRNSLLSGLIGRSMGLSGQKRQEFSQSIRLVSEETVRNCIDNKISLDTEPHFAEISVPILALAGDREPEEIIGSVKRMAELNGNCRFELIKNARHNIPMAFARQFNQRMIDFL